MFVNQRKLFFWAIVGFKVPFSSKIVGFNLFYVAIVFQNPALH